MMTTLGTVTPQAQKWKYCGVGPAAAGGPPAPTRCEMADGNARSPGASLGATMSTALWCDQSTVVALALLFVRVW